MSLQRTAAAITLVLCASCATTKSGAPVPPARQLEPDPPVAAQEEQGQCAIVYGDNWAFLLDTPPGWEGACHVEETLGVSVALWPAGSSFKDSEAVMYVTVAGKDGLSLSEFADDEVRRFTGSHTGATVQDAESIGFFRDRRAVVRHYSGDQFGNQEAVAYADQGQVFLVIVLSARNQAAFQASYSAFRALVGGIVPSALKFQ